MTYTDINAVCQRAPVIPVLVIEDAGKAVPLARALVAGGLSTLEVTLRTSAALDAIRAIADSVTGAVIGVGTLRIAEDVSAAVAAGAQFGVSPGFSAPVMDAAEGAGLPMLPGVATPSEAMAAADRGYRILKFFPAEVNGGVAALKAWGSALPDLRFCPTGGISDTNAAEYLNLPNVLCVGGSWVAPNDAVARGDWALIESLSRSASGLAAQ